MCEAATPATTIICECVWNMQKKTPKVMPSIKQNIHQKF